MKHIHLEITGTTPLICNRFTEEAQESATNSTRIGQVGERGTPREIANHKLYRDRDGKTLIIPGPNLFRCIIDGGKFFKAGKSKVTTLKSSLIPACVEISEISLPIKHKEPWEVDSRPIRMPSTGGRLLAHRPTFNDWSLNCTIILDTEVMSSKLLREIVDAAGKRCGLGDFRPACKGMFGKFVVTDWKEEELKNAA